MGTHKYQRVIQKIVSKRRFEKNIKRKKERCVAVLTVSQNTEIETFMPQVIQLHGSDTEDVPQFTISRKVGQLRYLFENRTNQDRTTKVHLLYAQVTQVVCYLVICIHLSFQHQFFPQKVIERLQTRHNYCHELFASSFYLKYIVIIDEK